MYAQRGRCSVVRKSRLRILECSRLERAGLRPALTRGAEMALDTDLHLYRLGYRILYGRAACSRVLYGRLL